MQVRISLVNYQYVLDRTALVHLQEREMISSDHEDVHVPGVKRIIAFKQEYSA